MSTPVPAGRSHDQSPDHLPRRALQKAAMKPKLSPASAHRPYRPNSLTRDPPHSRSYQGSAAWSEEWVAFIDFTCAIGFILFAYWLWGVLRSWTAASEAASLLRRQEREAAKAMAAAAVAVKEAAAEKIKMEAHMAYIKGPEVYWKLVEELGKLREVMEAILADED